MSVAPGVAHSDPAVAGMIASEILKSDQTNLTALLTAAAGASSPEMALRMAERAVSVAAPLYEAANSPVPASRHPDGLRYIQALVLRADANIRLGEHEKGRAELAHVRSDLDKDVDALRARDRILSVFSVVQPRTAELMLGSLQVKSPADAWTAAYVAWKTNASNAADLLDRAMELNPHVPAALIAHRDGETTRSVPTPARVGTPQEAALYAASLGDFWARTQGTDALEMFVESRQNPSLKA